MAPLTGIAFASNWLINKINLNSLSVKTTRVTTIFDHDSYNLGLFFDHIVNEGQGAVELQDILKPKNLSA